MSSFLRTFSEPDRDLQRPFDAAVVMPTILRPSLREAIASVFDQKFSGTIQVLIGIDGKDGGIEVVEQACARRPENCTVQVLYPGYSTSSRHGGLYPTRDGGALRCVLTYLANSRYVAYLDDDNWWHPDHLADLARSIHAGHWAYSLRWFVHPESRRPICVDRWESVGPGSGIFTEGFVDPNCLMIDKLACGEAIPRWTAPSPGNPTPGGGADRQVLKALRDGHVGVATGNATAYYVIEPKDPMHPLRLDLMGLAYDAAGAAGADQVDLDRARAGYLDIVDRPESTALALHQLALVAAARDDHARAAGLFRLCLRLNPTQPKAHTSLINALQILGDAAGAAAAMRELGNLLQSLGQHDQAQRMFGEAAAIDRSAR